MCDKLTQLADISIHALREEGDLSSSPSSSAGAHFYPRPPRGGRRKRMLRNSCACKNFYPRPPRGGRRVKTLCLRLRLSISIHALREEGDGLPWVDLDFLNLFLSTPSARRATEGASLLFYSHEHFYPRPPRGGRRPGRCKRPRRSAISIHALREEGDCRMVEPTGIIPYFYPRPPRGGRRVAHARTCGDVLISIHALREEGDGCITSCAGCWGNFYPRPPRGGRPYKRSHVLSRRQFLSTPSVRRATIVCAMLERKER